MTRLAPSYSVLTLLAVGALVVSAVTLLKGRRRSVRGVPLPPGPAPLPLVGNSLSIDAQKPWITYTKWAARYGDIFMIRVLKQDIIVINSEKIAKDLFERRSRIYSDRPYLSTRDPYGWRFNFAWDQYGDHWRTQRRIFHQAFRAEAVLAYRPVQLKMARKLILDILKNPHDYTTHIQRFAAAIIMSVVYDYEVAPEHDPLVELFERGNALAMEGLTPETASIIDAFPFLLSLPEWFPGSVFKRKARVSSYCAEQMITEPFEYATKREATGSHASAMALDLLRDSQDTGDSSRLRSSRDACATAFVAGAETTASTLQSFMLAMLLNPGAQARAQAEIDAVVGTNRLPDFTDRSNLPYVEAIFLETLRMYTTIPLGLPHATTTEDVYDGVFIPKGSTVVANIWAMHHNEDVFPEPDTFKPERFLVDGSIDERKSVDSLAFGFGRRVCPGRYTADNSVWAAIVSILSAFKITKALNKQGKELYFEPTFSYGVTTAPNPFPCSITPRSSSVDVCTLATTGL